jgi:hypothetical protein
MIMQLYTDVIVVAAGTVGSYKAWQVGKAGYKSASGKDAKIK